MFVAEVAATSHDPNSQKILLGINAVGVDVDANRGNAFASALPELGRSLNRTEAKS
jgi:hypothetical protein